MININYWMEYTIELAEKLTDETIRIAAVLVNDNELVAFSCNKNDNNTSWAKDLILKLRDKNIEKVENLFLTINSLNNNNEFDLNDLLKEIEIETIYLGLPDPKLDKYIDNDPIIKNKNTYRYSEDLQEKIYKQNINFYKDSKQSIEYNKYYYTHRVSHFVKEKLISYGIKLESDEISKRKRADLLSSYISKKYKMTNKKSYELITNIISEAFDYKYSEYDYSYDIRSINTDWSNNFKEIYEKTNTQSFDTINILNVGVGGGKEAEELFINCKNVTFVDIAPNGLKKIKKLIPSSKTIKSRAEDLSMIEDNSYELYVSLRTYNSSFFDIKEGIKEAYRVLKNNSVAIISISNGFLNQNEKKIIPGIIIPKLGFVDLYRGIDIVKNLSNILAKYNFKDIEITPTNGEIYISAKANKE